MNKVVLAFAAFFAFSGPAAAQIFIRPDDTGEMPIDRHVNPEAFKALELKVENNSQQIATLKSEMGEMKVLVIDLGEQLSKLQATVERLHPVRTEPVAPVEEVRPDQLPIVDADDNGYVAPLPVSSQDCVDGQCGVGYSQSYSGRVVFRRGLFRRR